FSQCDSLELVQLPVLASDLKVKKNKEGENTLFSGMDPAKLQVEVPFAEYKNFVAETSPFYEYRNNIYPIGVKMSANMELNEGFALVVKLYMNVNVTNADFTLGDDMPEITVPDPDESVANLKVFKFTNLNPRYFDEDITVRITVDGMEEDIEKTIRITDYLNSIYDYASTKLGVKTEKVDGKTKTTTIYLDPTLRALIADIFEYADALKEYVEGEEYEGGYTAYSGATVKKTEKPDPEKAINSEEYGAKKIVATDESNITFAAQFGYVVKLGFTVNVEGEHKVVVKINGQEVEAVDGRYITDPIMPTKYDDDIQLDFYIDDQLVQSGKFSITYYISRIKPSSSMYRLSRAVYYYGESAKAYQNAHN
ncbi:MAG: hypothetical protein MJ072_06360, partial [Clostridia bacterium]|nr:hypothetical protein [Clostridia bacterium]